jgi:hypothetical protein
METGNVTSPDGMVAITIPKGTIAKDKYGKGLGTLEVSVNDNPPPPPEDNQIIGLVYEFKPDGATFDPPITLTWHYDPDTLPSDVVEEDLVLAYYDEETKTWVTVDSIVDKEKHTITAAVSHLTDFAIIGKVTPLPALFSASNLLVQPNEVKPNEVVTATVTVTNTGGMEGTYNLTLKINGVNEETKDITVAAGASGGVSFTLSKQQPGIYGVDVNGLEGSFTVIAPPPATILPPSPTLPKPAPVPPPTPPPTSVLPPAPEPVSINWWLIIGGAIIACAVIGLAAWLMIARRRG